jgi:hypothetical protein
MLDDFVQLVREKESEEPERVRVSCPKPTRANARRSWQTLIVDDSAFRRNEELGCTDSGHYYLLTKNSDNTAYVELSYYSWWDVTNATFLERLEDWISISHPCVMPIMGIISKDTDLSLVLQTSWVCLLEDLLQKTNKGVSVPPFWTELTRAKIIVGIAHGMDHIHSHGIVHGTLSSHTILLDETGLPRITELSVPVATCKSTSGVEDNRKMVYYAPESLMGDSDDEEKGADVYSYGVLLYELVLGRRYIEDIGLGSRSSMVILSRISSGVQPAIPASVHPVVKEVITQC